MALFFTCLLPLIILLIMRKQGYISSIYLQEAKERTTPYHTTMICYATWLYTLIKCEIYPLFFSFTILGSIIALICVCLINRRWKISAHLTAFGGLCGGIMNFYLFYNDIPSVALIGVLLCLALLLMYARLYIKAHTSLQVVCGYLLGLVTTSAPIFTYHYLICHNLTL